MEAWAAERANARREKAEREAAEKRAARVAEKRKRREAREREEAWQAEVKWQKEWNARERERLAEFIAVCNAGLDRGLADGRVDEAGAGAVRGEGPGASGDAGAARRAAAYGLHFFRLVVHFGLLHA